MSNKITVLTPNRVLEIRFADEVQPGDLDILVKATRARPGLARLKAAHLGEAEPEAPNSRPVYSGSEAKIGFVASSREAEPPYQHTYLLQTEVAR